MIKCPLPKDNLETYWSAVIDEVFLFVGQRALLVDDIKGMSTVWYYF